MASKNGVNKWLEKMASEKADETVQARFADDSEVTLSNGVIISVTHLSLLFSFFNTHERRCQSEEILHCARAKI